MDSKDYTDLLYAEVRAAREDALQAKLTLSRVSEWLAYAKNDSWNPVYLDGAVKEMEAHRAYMKRMEKKEVAS